MNKHMKIIIFTGYFFVFCFGVVAWTAGQGAGNDIRPGSGVTVQKLLSDYLPSLAETPGDTPVYFMNGKDPGATVLVAGGTHGNEIAGIMAAAILVEHARVQKGRVIVIPHANNSAIGYVDAKRPGPAMIVFDSPGGKRRFRVGSRLTRPEDQGEGDPAKYRHPDSAEELDGVEARNLDRAYPGRSDGNLTQRVAHAIMLLLRREAVDVAFDLHESGPDSRLAWMVVANPKNIDVAAGAILTLDAAGIPMKLEPSSDSFRGLSHREWGDATRAQAYLFETPNPAMGERRGAVDVVNDPELPLARRVGVQLATLVAILDAYNESAPANLSVKLLDVPGLQQVMASGVGAFLK